MHRSSASGWRRRSALVAALMLPVGLLVSLGGAAAAATGATGVTGGTAARPAHGAGLDAPAEKNIAMAIVSSNENSTLDWQREYGYIQNIHDGRGYTAGLIGFTSGTGDMLRLVEAYTRTEPHNVLAPFIPALKRVDGTGSTKGLGKPYVAAWKQAADDPVFRHAQMHELDVEYFDPAVDTAKRDGLGTLGQFIYYDAMVMHGPGNGLRSFGGIRRVSMQRAKTPAQGGSEIHYLDVFLDVRRQIMKHERKHHNTSRIDTEQRVFLDEHKLGLRPPLVWHVYGQRFEIRS